MNRRVVVPSDYAAIVLEAEKRGFDKAVLYRVINRFHAALSDVFDWGSRQSRSYIQSLVILTPPNTEILNKLDACSCLLLLINGRNNFRNFNFPL
ncbi:hypothetical protein D3C75_592600 [compost metagenome]